MYTAMPGAERRAHMVNYELKCYHYLCTVQSFSAVGKNRVSSYKVLETPALIPSYLKRQMSILRLYHPSALSPPSAHHSPDS